MCSHRLDAPVDAAGIVSREVVHDDFVAELEGRGWHVGHVGAEGLPVHATVDLLGRIDAAGAQERREDPDFPAIFSGFWCRRPCSSSPQKRRTDLTGWLVLAHLKTPGLVKRLGKMSAGTDQLVPMLRSPGTAGRSC